MIREGIALGEVVAVFVAGKIAVFVVFEALVERVISAKPDVVKVFVFVGAEVVAPRLPSLWMPTCPPPGMR